MKWQMRIVATLAGLIVAVPTGVHTQKPMTLTALDYIEIEQLVAKYSRALDSCSNNGYDYADLYTPDGVFAPTLNGKPGPIGLPAELLICQCSETQPVAFWPG